MAALKELKNYIRSCDVWVNGSQLQKDFEEYLCQRTIGKRRRFEGLI
jgi:hypothetical protein